MDRLIRFVRRMWKGQTYLYGALFLAVLLGAVLANNYGQSWDDPSNAAYGLQSLRGYLGIDVFNQNPFWRSHGPAYFMLSALIGKILGFSWAGQRALALRHFLNFNMFLIGVVSVFLIGRRLFTAKISLAVATLFASQPILFGHAFINQKDIPFMALFCASIAAGLFACDRWLKNGPHGTVNWAAATSIWRTNTTSQKIAGICLASGGLIMLLAIWFPGSLHSFLRTFTLNQIPTNRIEIALGWLRLVLSILPVLLFAAALAATGIDVRAGLEKARAWLLPMVFAGALIGITTAVRIVGPFAGLLVAFYALWNAPRWRTLILLAGLAAIALVICYLAWPYLWQEPISRVAEIINLTSNYEDRPVLYMGLQTWSDELPWHFIPVLLGIQLTLPALLLILFGLGLQFMKQLGQHKSLTGVLILWLLVPLLPVLLGRTPIYDNFRQFLFVLPPLFLFSGFALEWLLAQFNPWWWRAILAACLLPGILAIGLYHPYQYVYYNQLVGGIRGAAGSFELDYWCTSYREVVKSVNARTPNGAVVAVYGPIQVASTFADESIQIVGNNYPTGALDYAIGCENAVMDPAFYPEFEIVDKVALLGVPIGIIKANQDK